MSGEKTQHVADYKKETVKDIIDLIKEYPIIGAVNMENLPTPQLQKMRAVLRDKVVMTMTKRRLMKIAIEQCKATKKGIEKIEPYLKGMPALIFTKENPFALFKMLKKSKSPAPAKPGQTAPKDIVVAAGPTDFAPGPIIGELAQIGIKSGVEGGKVAIKQDSVVVKEGEKIKPQAANILTRLGLTPMEVGLDLVAVYEKGTIYPKKILDIDEEQFMAQLQEAASGAINLSVFIGYPTKDNINLMLSKAFNDAKALALEYNIIGKDTIREILTKAEIAMLDLKEKAKITVKEKPAEKVEVKKEEIKVEKPKVEEKPKEIPKAEIKEEKKIEKKEEKILEKEEEIIKEEKKLEKEEAKPKIEAPVEKEIEKDVKEEEEKKLEQERIEKEKELEGIEKEKYRKSKISGKLEKPEVSPTEARRKAEEEERKREEEKKKAEEARQKAEEEARRKAKEEEARKAEEERKRKEIEEKERKKAEEEARKKAEEARRVEEEKRKEGEERRKLEEQKKLEEERRKAEEAKRLEGERKRQEEQKRIEEARKAEEAKKKAELEETEKKVAELVKRTKLRAAGEEPTAERLIKEVEDVKAREAQKPEIQEEIKKEEKPKEPEGKTAEELLNILKEKGTLRELPTQKVEPEKKEEKPKEKKRGEKEEIEDLTQQLIKKGSLRKK